MKMEHIECPETLAYKIQTPGNYPEESIQHLNIRYNENPTPPHESHHDMNAGFEESEGSLRT
jgi:hypothetical protein